MIDFSVQTKIYPKINFKRYIFSAALFWDVHGLPFASLFHLTLRHKRISQAQPSAVGPIRETGE